MNIKTLTPFALAAALALGSSIATAQVAGGTTTTDISITESTQLASGWSVKKTLMGKTVYNESGQKVGKVEDLIVAPDRNVSYVIVGAGGFIGIGRHDVAVPVTQIQDKAGRLTMAGATKESLKAMPVFDYAADSSGQRARFIAAADKDIARGKTQVVALEKKVGVAAADAKAQLNLQVNALQVDVKATEAKLAEMKQASAARWKEFEGGVTAATARVRKAVDALTA